MLREGIIEPSNSPWRAQVVVVKDKKKERLEIDYSETINKFTELDAYPLPLISEYINNLAQYKVFSKIDLKSAYHQIPINKHDNPIQHLSQMADSFNSSECHSVLQTEFLVSKESWMILLRRKSLQILFLLWMTSRSVEEHKKNMMSI